MGGKEGGGEGWICRFSPFLLLFQEPKPEERREDRRKE
jgi:hypothetical protein